MSHYSSTVLADSPIRYYRLNESSGTNIVDSGSQAHNGTLNGGVTLSQAGLIFADSDTSMLFNGTTGYISLPTTSLPTSAGAWTLEAWVKMPSSLPANFPVPLHMGTSTGGASNATSLVYNAGTVSLGDGQNFLITGGTLVANGVYHLVGTYDGTTAKLYINGVSIGSTTHTYTVAYGVSYIGNDDSSDFWNGIIDEAAIYSTALSSTRVFAHWNAGYHQVLCNGYGGVFR